MIWPTVGNGAAGYGGYGGYGGGAYGYEYGCVGYFTVLVIIFGMLICFCCAFSGLGYAFWKQKSRLEYYTSSNGGPRSTPQPSFMQPYTV